MLLDLGRNDIGRVSDPGTVEVTKMLEVERFSHVMHLVSHVEGTPSAKTSPPTTPLRSCFPAGTVSGAPKIRAMEIITEVEGETPRPPTAAQSATSATPATWTPPSSSAPASTRTAVMYVQAGGGIVADSVARGTSTRRRAHKVQRPHARHRPGRGGVQDRLLPSHSTCRDHKRKEQLNMLKSFFHTGFRCPRHRGSPSASTPKSSECASPAALNAHGEFVEQVLAFPQRPHQGRLRGYGRGPPARAHPVPRTGQRPPTPSSETTSGAAHLAFFVEDLDRFYEDTRERGLQYNNPPAAMFDDSGNLSRKACYARDPDGKLARVRRTLLTGSDP